MLDGIMGPLTECRDKSIVHNAKYMVSQDAKERKHSYEHKTFIG